MIVTNLKPIFAHTCLDLCKFERYKHSSPFISSEHVFQIPRTISQFVRLSIYQQNKNYFINKGRGQTDLFTDTGGTAVDREGFKLHSCQLVTFR